MSIRNKPNYGVYFLNLTNAGSFDLPDIGSRIVMSGALSGASVATLSGGGQTLSGGTPASAVVNVQIGKALGDPIPFSVGTSVVVENKFDFVRLTWAAQNGVYAIFVISDDADGNGVNVTAPPTVTLGNMSIVEGGNTAVVNAAGDLQVAVMGQGGAQGGTNANPLVVTQSGFSGPINNPALNPLPPSSAGGTPQIQPGTLGGSFFAASAAAGAATIVAAASNTHGIVVRTAALTANAGTLSLCGGTSAPTTQFTNPSFLSSNQNLAVAVLPREIFLPAGQGLYVWNGGSAIDVFATYDIL